MTYPDAQQPSLEHSRFAFDLMQMTLFETPTRRRRRWRLARNAAQRVNGRLLLAGGIIFDEQTSILENPDASPRLRYVVSQAHSYADGHRRFIHLVDGGLADNLGLRGALDRPWFENNPQASRPRSRAAWLALVSISNRCHILGIQRPL
jgi:hypothetical protein